MKITKELAAKVLETVDAGLIYGLGDPEPGQMCVEAAVNYALGGPHDDHPKCVNRDLANFKINLNDNGYWPNEQARAQGLRRVAIAQLGSNNKSFSFKKFSDLLTARIQPMLDAAYEKQEQPYLKKLAAISKKLLKVRSGEQISAIRDELRDIEYSLVERPDVRNAAPDWIAGELQSWTSWDNHKILKFIAEEAVQVLIQMKVPGTKYLYLTENKRKPKAKAKAKRRKE